MVAAYVADGGFVLVFVAGSGNAGGPAAATASATNTPICLAKEGSQGRDPSLAPTLVAYEGLGPDFGVSKCRSLCTRIHMVPEHGRKDVRQYHGLAAGCSL